MKALTTLLLASLLMGGTARQAAAQQQAGYEPSRSANEGAEFPASRQFERLLDGDTRFSGEVFPFESEYFGYPTPFDDSGYPGAYQRPFAPEHDYRFDGDNYGYGGYDYGYGDMGYRESLRSDSWGGTP